MPNLFFSESGDVLELVYSPSESHVIIVMNVLFFFRFRYALALLNAFSGGGIANLQNLDNQGRFPRQNHELFFSYAKWRSQVGFQEIKQMYLLLIMTRNG